MKRIYDHFKIEAQVSGLGNWMTMLPFTKDLKNRFKLGKGLQF